MTYKPLCLCKQCGGHKNFIHFGWLQSVWETELRTHLNISGCAWTPPAVGNLVPYWMPLSVISHLSMFKCFLALSQTWFCPFRIYRVIPRLLLDDCLQYLRRSISCLILSIFPGVTLPVSLNVLYVMSCFRISTYPVCSISVWTGLAKSVLVDGVQNSTLSHKPIISYLT